MSIASELLEVYVKCEKALLLGGKSVQLGDRMLTRADLQWVQKEREKLEFRVNAENRKSGSLRITHANFSKGTI